MLKNNTSTGLKSIKIILLGIALLLVWYVISITFELALASFYIDLEKFFDSFHYLIIDWISENLILIFIVFLILKKNKQSFMDLGWSGGFEFKKIVLILTIGIFLWIAQVSITYYSRLFLPENFPANEMMNIFEKHSTLYNKVILFFLLVIVTPIGEEIFMRGFIYRLLRLEYNTYISILISTLIFIIFHPVLAWLPSLIIVNIVICLIYEKSKLIWDPILLHASINFLGFINIVFNIGFH